MLNFPKLFFSTLLLTNFTSELIGIDHNKYPNTKINNYEKRGNNFSCVKNSSNNSNTKDNIDSSKQEMLGPGQQIIFQGTKHLTDNTQVSIIESAPVNAGTYMVMFQSYIDLANPTPHANESLFFSIFVNGQPTQNFIFVGTSNDALGNPIPNVATINAMIPIVSNGSKISIMAQICSQEPAINVKINNINLNLAQIN